MTDNDSVRSSAKPRGGRPAPSGPRVRQQSSFTNLLSLDAISNHRDSSATSSSRDSTLYSPGPSSPRIPTTPTRNSVEPPPPGETKLAVITESPTATSPPSPSPPPQFTQSSEPNDTAPTLTPSSRPTSREIPSRPPSRVPSPSPSPSPSPVPRARVVSKQTTVLPPPQIKFESTQIQWKGLPLEAALWTLDSRDLQVIVSRAIRSSAQESFIRLLSTKQLDEELPTELDRLKSLKAMTQARYRFNAQRRSMLLQALMSFSESGDNKQDSVGPTVGRLAVQLSETTIECDKLSQELVAIMDQINQVQRLLDVHWASALAIALRKLNGSYGKRTAELNQSRQRITQLEGELEDAWKEAEKMAQEIDDINAMDSDEEDEEDISRVVIQKAQVISVPQSAKPVYVSSPSAPPSAPSSASPDKSSFDKETKIDTAQLPPPGSAVGSAFPISPDVEDEDDGDAASLRSRKSAKSFGAQSRVSAVSAARKRSLRTSMGSLRLPVRTLSLVNLQRHPPVHPPVPAIPKKFSPGGALSPSTSAAPVEALHSLHGLKKRNGSDISLVDETLTAGQFEDVKNSRRISIDELNIETSAVPHLPGAQYMPRRERPTSVMDDLYLSTRAPSSIGHTEEDSGMNIGGVGVGFLLGGLGGVSGLGFGSGSYGPYSTPAARKRRGSVDEQSIIANARRIGKGD
ncbi:hypothetical protein D9758_011171 [Tetrapyrgos nigripes]|uniref:Uncharacterized protein n=1 Tax=Tetrapyrgos nigripes TaxID=182062 RepID=A0A8H5D8C8_9AGAR|nr:hypothetical protein D9758_011171 [Tetrapyrgos nigripes]